MQKLIFHKSNFFEFGHFLDYFLGSQGWSYLDNKCSPSLWLPAIRCTKLGMKYGFPLISLTANPNKMIHPQHSVQILKKLSKRVPVKIMCIFAIY